MGKDEQLQITEPGNTKKLVYGLVPVIYFVGKPDEKDSYCHGTIFSSVGEIPFIIRGEQARGSALVIFPGRTTIRAFGEFESNGIFAIETVEVE